jgi:uncharacterized protein (DUF2141 family)
MPTDKSNEKKGTKPLTVVIDNLASANAPVVVSIYGTGNKFPSRKDQFKSFRFTPSGTTLTEHLTGIPHGTYAIATFQDLNGDGEIATNMFGIPTDPYGFSNNYHPRVKAPTFKDCSFEYDDHNQTVSIRMIR